MSDPAPHQRLRRLQSISRFGCGFVLGIVLALSLGILQVGVVEAIAFIFLVGAIVGWLSLRYGDRFWQAFLRWWR